MPGPQVAVASDIYRQLRTDFIQTYKKHYEGMKAELGLFMELAKPSDKLTEYYGYFESAPYPQRWDRGTGIQRKAFKSKAFSVTNYRFGEGVKWSLMDREDEQLKDLPSQARMCGMNFALVPELSAYEILLASASLLAAIPNAPDGVAIHSATDGSSADRYGVSGGNIISGSGVDNPEDIVDDIFSAIIRMLQFQDTEGKPLFHPSMMRQGFVVTYNVANEKVWGAALKQMRTVATRGTAGTDLAAAAVTNLIRDYGLDITPVPTQYITDNDAFLFAKNPPVPCLFEQVRRPLTEKTAFSGDNNSDSVRDYEEEYIDWSARLGYGVGPAFTTVKINN